MNLLILKLIKKAQAYLQKKKKKSCVKLYKKKKSNVSRVSLKITRKWHETKLCELKGSEGWWVDEGEADLMLVRDEYVESRGGDAKCKSKSIKMGNYILPRTLLNRLCSFNFRINSCDSLRYDNTFLSFFFFLLFFAFDK